MRSIQPIIESQLHELADLCRRFHVRRLEVFGSVTTDRFNPDTSDLDFLVEFETLGPDCDIYMLADYFRTKLLRRFPIVEDERLLGQVSRRDVLRGIEEMRRKRTPRKHYPDYREPA